MARIVPKLNLNKTPQYVDNNSLVFAKNIKLLEDFAISRDDGIYKLDLDEADIKACLVDKENNYRTQYNLYKYYLDNLRSAHPLTSLDIYMQYIAGQNYSLSVANLVDVGQGWTQYHATQYKLNTEHAGTEGDPFIKRKQLTNSTQLWEDVRNLTYNRGVPMSSEFRYPLFDKEFYIYLCNNVVKEGAYKPSLIAFDYDDWYDKLVALKDSDITTFNKYFTDCRANIKQDTDGTYYYEEMYFNYAYSLFYKHADNIIAVLEDFKKYEASNNAGYDYKKSYYEKQVLYYTNRLKDIEYYNDVLDDFDNYKIVGVIPHNTSFYILYYNSTTKNSLILVYNERTNSVEICNTNWNYSGGEITGLAELNLRNEVILNIAESGVDGTLIPFKTINLNESSHSDDESIYTQIPNIPYYNLNFVNYYSTSIPNGVYQFYIRYKIRDNYYTNWFPATKELFAGNTNRCITAQGSLSYVNIKVDSDVSFILQVDKAFIREGVISESIANNYEAFQIGFILSHDDVIVAKAWKQFPMTTDLIYFTWDKEFIEDIDITDLTNDSFGIYNVKNLTTFKNKLYISNYTETDFNPDLQEYADNIVVTTGQESPSDVYKYYDYVLVTNKRDDGFTYITNIKTADDTVNLTISNIISSLVNTAIYTLIDSPDKDAETLSKTETYMGITVYCKRKLITGSGTGVHYTVHTRNNILTNIQYDYKYINANTGQFVQQDTYRLTSNTYKFTYQDQNGTTLTNRYQFEVTFSINADAIKTSESVVGLNTLLPYKSYNFYIHYIKANGESTHGYLCVKDFSIDTANIDLSTHPVIYPIFSNITLPSGYIGCFFSIQEYKNHVAEIFDIHNENTLCIGDCIELDTRLFGPIKEIPCIVGSDTYTVNYHPSFDSSDLNLFGASGKVKFSSVISGSNIPNGFIKLNYENNLEYAPLIKCTPYIPLKETATTYNSSKQLNIKGYVCEVTKLADNIDTYSGGDDLYHKEVINTSIRLNNFVVNQTVDEYQNHILYATGSDIIYSEYNLNYLSLTEDAIPTIKTVGDTTETRKSYIFDVRHSLQLSDVYELKSMYKDYTRKVFVRYDVPDISTTFNNTIRSSQLHGDEDSVNLNIFRAVDYYNVPTNKGIIINLVAVGEAILVHTQDSLFKFAGYNSLTASGGEEIQTSETDPFESGIGELFGSERGYAGLQNKSESCVTQTSYFWYDHDSNIIYMYGGKEDLAPISMYIFKLLQYDTILNIDFANDFYNNRIFVNIAFNNGKFATLSYNTALKSFVSLHDFDYNKSFYTKTKCYFIKGNSIYTNNRKYYGYSDLVKYDSLYPCYTSSRDGNKCAIVDIIFNENYEATKVLNSVNWICSLIKGFGDNWNSLLKLINTPTKLFVTDNEIQPASNMQSVPNASAEVRVDKDTVYQRDSQVVNMNSRDIRDSFMAEENLNRNYPGCELRIYTDSSATPLMSISPKSNDYSISNPESYKLPRYNLGKWSLNYFRNILDTTNLFGYLNSYDDGRRTAPQSPQYISDESSLIYGKYFVARFIFDITDDFKFENLSFNTNITV